MFGISRGHFGSTESGFGRTRIRNTCWIGGLRFQHVVARSRTIPIVTQFGAGAKRIPKIDQAPIRMVFFPAINFSL